MLDPTIFTDELPPTPCERLAAYRKRLQDYLCRQWARRINGEPVPDDKDLPATWRKQAE